METRHLKIFVAVYKNKSFTRAAEQLYTSQPTISEHIRNLENRLDCKLFDRLGRSIIPTLEADLLYPRALAILDDLKKLENELGAVGKNVAGKITIAASTIPSAYLLPRLAADFASLHPRISFEIRTFDSEQVVKTLLANETLLGFVGAASESEKLHYHPFMKDQLVLAASSRKKINQRITARTLLELPFILREEGSGTRKSLEHFLRQNDLFLDQFNICAVLGSSTAVTEAVKNDLGVSILSRHAVKDAVNYGQVQIIDIVGLEMNRDFYVVTPRKRSLPHHYQVFLKYVLQSPQRDTE